MLTLWPLDVTFIFDTRHPNSDLRPEFGVIVTQLNRPDYVLLKLPQDENKDALTLKAPLKHSHDLYIDLQQQYFPK